METRRHQQYPSVLTSHFGIYVAVFSSRCQDSVGEHRWNSDKPDKPDKPNASIVYHCGHTVKYLLATVKDIYSLYIF